MKTSSSKKFWKESWTFIGSGICFAACGGLLVWDSRNPGVLPVEWKDIIVGLGAGNLLAIMLRMKSLRFYRKEDR